MNKNQQKSVWGIIFLMFLVCFAGTILYYISQAPQKALGFVSDTSLDIFAFDASVKKSLADYDKRKVQFGYTSEDIEAIKPMITQEKERVNVLQNKVNSLTQLDRWALDNYDGTLELHVKRMKLLVDALDNHIAFLQTHEVEFASYQLVLSTEDINADSCKRIEDAIDSMQPTFDSLTKQVQNKVVNLQFQNKVYAYVKKHTELRDQVTQLSEKNCPREDVVRLLSESAQNEEYLFVYVPRTDLYITNSYTESVQNILQKIDDIIDKVQ